MGTFHTRTYIYKAMNQPTLFAPIPLPKVIIFTDGACVPNPGAGGWAAILKSGSTVREIRGFEHQTTNNRMEMMAVISALESLKKPCSVELFTDSMILVYLLNGRGKKPSKRANPDLVQRIIQLMQIHQIEAKWVKGHSGHPENERCDELAMLAIKENVFTF